MDKTMENLQLSFITPTTHIKEFGSQSDFILALAHLIDLNKENDYEKAIKETNLPLWLDNSLFEHEKPEPLDQVLDKAIKIGAHMFFSPDYLYDAKKTKDQIDVTYDLMLKKGLIEGYRDIYENKILLGAVVQADNKEEWIKQYIDFTNDGRINIIGLSILSIPKSFGGSITESRIKCLKELLKLDLKHKKVHLLGIGDSYKDVLFAKENCDFVESNDSSCPFQSGLFGKKLTDNLEVPDGKIKEKVNFKLKEINDKQREDIQYNISIIKRKIYDSKSQ
jgi:hypothetical protein